MQFHRGRLIDHVHLVVRDLEASKRFYAAVLASVGRSITHDGPDCDSNFGWNASY